MLCWKEGRRERESAGQKIYIKKRELKKEEKSAGPHRSMYCARSPLPHPGRKSAQISHAAACCFFIFLLMRYRDGRWRKRVSSLEGLQCLTAPLSRKFNSGF